MRTEIQHFHWVAQGNGLPEGESAWHLMVIDVAETMADVETLGGVSRRERMLDMDAAEAEGFTLAIIGTKFKASAAAKADAAAKRVKELEDESENATRSFLKGF